MKTKRYIAYFLFFISMIMLIVPVIPHHHHEDGIICMKNDLPISEPQSFRAVGAVTFQIYSNYLDATPAGHAGETRAQRVLEYNETNPQRCVAGLRGGCMHRRA